jgi:hypothetical protein
MFLYFIVLDFRTLLEKFKILFMHSQIAKISVGVQFQGDLTRHWLKYLQIMQKEFAVSGCKIIEILLSETYIIELCVAQVRVIFLLPPDSIKYLFPANSNKPLPQYLAYVEWFSTFTAAPQNIH